MGNLHLLKNADIFGKHKKLNLQQDTLKIFGQTRKPAHNSTFAIAGVSCSVDSFVVKGSSVLRIKFCGEKPRHRKSAKRYGQV